MSNGEWFHSSRTTIKRSEGRSVVAAAAYRTASRLTCEREMTTHDYTRKQGVAEVFVTTPLGKTDVEWAQDIPRLANAMEASEKRKDAQLGHEWTIALPAAPLSDEQRSGLSHRLAQKLSDLYGVAVIAAIHRPGQEGDERNHHVHLLFTTRQVEPDGKLGAKVTVVTDRKTSAEEVTRFRQITADLINDALADAGSAERVSPLSFEARGIQKEPTTHLGPSASEMERRAPGSSDRGDMNREVAAHNQALDQLVVELAALDAEIAEAEEQRLDVRYGALEPDPRIVQPAVPEPLQTPAVPPRETLEASFAAAIRPGIEEMSKPVAAWTAAPDFDAAIRPALATLQRSGETWSGATLWEKTAELYRRARDAVTDISHDVLNRLWELMRGRTVPPQGDRDDARNYWRRVATPNRGREPQQERDGPER